MKDPENFWPKNLLNEDSKHINLEIDKEEEKVAMELYQNVT
jgi:hypothetical protein